MQDSLTLYSQTINSRFLLGTALYPSPQIMQEAILAAEAEIITVSLRRQSPEKKSGHNFWDFIRELDAHLLPNTAGCYSAKEAIATAEMARELFDTNWIKLEVIGDEYNLQPHPFELLNAAETLTKEGFEVFPYCTDDLILCQKLVDAGCQVLMPWGAPIGTGRGLNNPYALKNLRKRIPNIPLIIDAGIGQPSHATNAMEIGYDAILLNTAVAQARNPTLMAQAFKHGIKAGREAYLAGTIEQRDTAQPSTPTLGTPFWHQSDN